MNQNGEPCGVSPELLMASGWCFGHDPARGLDRKAASAIGGLKSTAKRRRGLDASELGALNSAGDAKRWAATIALAVATGRLSSAQGRTVLVALTAWTRAHEVEELERLDAEDED